MDRLFNLVIDSFPKILIAGIKWTIPITIISFVFGLIIAFILSFIQYKNVKILRELCKIYVWVFRGSPVLVQLFVIFYGLPNIGIVLNPFTSSIVVFSLNVAAYLSESILGAFYSIEKGQYDAAYSLGMSYMQTMIYVIIPQALISLFPTFSNHIISLVKDTSLSSSITVMEMLMVTKSIVARTYEPLVLYLEVGFIYLMISTILTFAQRVGEKKIYKWIN